MYVVDGNESQDETALRDLFSAEGICSFIFFRDSIR